MKKVAILFSILVWGVVAFGQSTPAAVAVDGYISDPVHQYIWGSAADTISNADTLNFVWRVRGRKVYDINAKLYLDFVSGTASGTVISYHSIDGVNFSATGDTITYTEIAADAMDSEVIDLNDFTWPYLKVTLLQSGTGVNVPKLYLYAKEN